MVFSPTQFQRSLVSVKGADPIGRGDPADIAPPWLVSRYRNRLDYKVGVGIDLTIQCGSKLIPADRSPYRLVSRSCTSPELLSHWQTTFWLLCEALSLHRTSILEYIKLNSNQHLPSTNYFVQGRLNRGGLTPAWALRMPEITTHDNWRRKRDNTAKGYIKINRFWVNRNKTLESDSMNHSTNSDIRHTMTNGSTCSYSGTA